MKAYVPSQPAFRSGGHGGWLAAAGSAFCLALAFLLAGCGGGATNTAGVGSGGSGVAEGSVTGFGSLIVDGVEYDDSNASVQADGGGGLRNVAAKLGQRVRLGYDAQNRTEAVLVLPQLIGPVTAAVDASHHLAVMGQPVQLVSASQASQLGMPTVLDGWSAASGIASGDEVEVHGAWYYDSGSGSYQLAATRIEKLAAAADPVLISGVAQTVSANALRLDSANGDWVNWPQAGQAVTAGQVVQLWLPRAAMYLQPLSPTRLLDASAQLAAQAGQGLRLSGPASNYDAAANTVDIQGMRISLPPGLALDGQNLAGGGFLDVDAAPDQNQLVAGSARQTPTPGGGTQTVTLKGIANNIDWSAANISFTLRQIQVSASQASLDASCRALSAAYANVYVVVAGSLPANQGTAGVVASSVTCSLNPPGGASVDLSGQVSQVNLAAGTLLLATTRGGVSATWDANTYFALSPASLAGQSVEVEGAYGPGNVLHLTQVRQGN